jgi:hypothetical protein
MAGATLFDGAITTTPGPHVLKVVQGAGEDCTDETVDWTETPVDLHDVAAQTLAIGWTNNDGQEPVNDTWIFDDSQDCLPVGQSRIVFRNVSTDFELRASLGSDTAGALDTSGATELLSNVTQGGEASADVEAGTYPADASERMFGWRTGATEPFVGSDALVAVPQGTIAYVYAHSGNDGPVGLAITSRDVGVCGEQVTTTTSTSTTTMPGTTTTTVAAKGTAEAAHPVSAKPTYTG